jgi:hypothetical protein
MGHRFAVRGSRFAVRSSQVGSRPALSERRIRRVEGLASLQTPPQQHGANREAGADGRQQDEVTFLETFWRIAS